MRIMRWCSLVWLLTLVLSTPVAGASEPWQSQGPTGTMFHSLAQAPDGSIFAGTVSGLYRYGDPADGWLPVPLERDLIGQVFVSSEGVLFAQDYSGGCVPWYGHFVSNDDGQTWSDDDGLYPENAILAFAETPDGTVWAATTGGDLYRRDFGTARWREHHPSSSMSAMDLAVTSDGSLLVLGYTSEFDEWAVFLSDDSGQNWSIPLKTTTRLSAIAVNPSGYVVVGGTGPLPGTVTFFSSTDSGRNWFERPCQSDACSELTSVTGLAILPNRTVAAAGLDSNRVSSRLVVSDLFMETWSLAAHYSENPSDLLTDRNGAFWVVGLPYAWRSTDNAESFEAASNGLIDTSVTNLVESGGQLFAAVGSYRVGGFFGFNPVPGSAGVHVSTDRGATWSETPVWQANQVTASLSGDVFAATDIGAQRSTDQGITWQTIPGTEGSVVRAVAADPLGTLCMVTGSRDVRCSDDGGLSWYGDLHLGASDNAMTALPDRTFLIEASGTVHRSTDGGHTWDPTPLAENIGPFAVSPDGEVYAPVYNSDLIVVSEDSGFTWDFIETPLSGPLSIALHPVRGLFVGYYAAVLYSRDRFETWDRIDIRAESLIVSGDRVVAGNESRGVWLADLPPRVRHSSGRVGR